MKRLLFSFVAVLLIIPTGAALANSFQVTPSWTNGGTVTLESPAGTSVSISNGQAVVIAGGDDAEFTVIGNHEITAVYIDGNLVSDPNALTPPSYQRLIISPQEHIYTFVALANWSGMHTIAVQFAHEIEMESVGSGDLIAPVGVTVGGTVVNDSSATVTADHNTSPSFTISPDAGQCLVEVLIDNVPVGAFANTANKTQTTISSIASDRRLEAQFGRAEITILLGADDGQTGSNADLEIQNPASPSGWRAYLADAAYNFDPSQSGPDFIAQGNHGDSFAIPDDMPATVGCDARYIVIQFLDVDGWLKPINSTLDLQFSFNDQTVEGLYDKDSYTLTLVAQNGSISAVPAGIAGGAGATIYSANESVTLTAQPDLNWYFHLWQQDASGSGSPLTITMDQDKTIEAVFVQACQDSDGDLYTTNQGNTNCQPSAELDCNDTTSLIYPGAPEICGDGIDQDCSGGDLACSGDDVDNDGDGFTENQGDCNDTNASIYPGALEIVGNNIDEDCYEDDKLAGVEVTCVTPSDIPIAVARKPAPPLIMMLLDDSFSMSSEFSVQGESEGYFNYNNVAKTYLIDYPIESKNGQNNPSYLLKGQIGLTEILGEYEWRTQWSEYNRLFFDPDATYDPWPFWDVVAQSVSATDYMGQEQMVPRPNEFTYDNDNSSFPDRAFADGFRHADMDQPRNNTINPQSGHSWSYISGNNKSQVTNLNDEWFSVNVDTSEQWVVVYRDGQSTGNNTRADAIGLSTNPNLETNFNSDVSFYLQGNGVEPEIIVDDADGVDIDGDPSFGTTANWFNSNIDQAYRWPNAAQSQATASFAQGLGQLAFWRVKLTQQQQNAGDSAGGYYVYAWTGYADNIDSNALYQIYHYNQFMNSVLDEVRVNQQPIPPAQTSTVGGRWIRLNNTPYRFIKEPQLASYEIKFAHYFVWWDSNGNQVEDLGELYLINIPGSGYNLGDYTLEYYQFNDLNSNDRVDSKELVLLTNPPPEIVPVRYDETGNQITDLDELAYVVRQNFADWFSFYRNRMLTAKSAVGLTVYDFENVELGVHTINRGTHEPLKLMVSADGPEKIDFLKAIYNISERTGGTPLKRGYYDVARYFDSTNNNNDYNDLQTTEGLPSGDTSVFWDANTSIDNDTIDDSGGECQRSYVIMVTDGFYYGNDPINLGNSDGDNLDGNARYALRDSAVNTLADFAHYYYHRDLDTNLDDKLTARGYDDATTQHLTTFGVAFGVSGSFDPAMFPDCLPACDEPGTPGCPNLDELGRVNNCVQQSDGTVICDQICTQTDPNDPINCTTINSAGPFLGVCPEWPNQIIDGAKQTIDDLFHASVNGRGEFLNAAKPGDLIQAMRKIKTLVEKTQGTAASVAINSNKIGNDTLLYQTVYNADKWSGDILAKCFDRQGDIAHCGKVACQKTCIDDYNTCLDVCALGDDNCLEVCKLNQADCFVNNSCDAYQTCDAAHSDCLVNCNGNSNCELICGQTEAACLDNPPEVKWRASDNIGTWDLRPILTADSNGRGLPFRWGDNDDLTADGLTAAMKVALNGNVEQLRYLRGYQGCESGNTNNCSNSSQFRFRDSILGDFINAEPYYYKNDDLGIDWLIAGANDGMLHVVDAQSGVEVFNYVPHMAYQNLTELSAPGYNLIHKFFVDGYTVAEELGSASLLVGTMRKGGKGLFGLDLEAAVQATNLEAAAGSVVKWEISVNSPDTVTNPSVANAFSDHLGYTFSRPAIIKSNDPSASWLVVFGNGYESALGRAVLFLIGLDDGGEIVWTQVIDTGVGNADPAITNCNGLSTPAILYPQGDQENDYIYAGDLLGNLWKFDISSSNRADWNIYFNDGANSQNQNNGPMLQPLAAPQPLFTARSNGDGQTGYRQPITAKPAIRSSCALNAEGYLITFGTGRLYDPALDGPDQSVQTIYGIWDWSAEWEAQGFSGSDKYLGAFENSSTDVAASCINACDNIELACTFDCLGNSACELDCLEAEEACTFNCSSTRTLSNMNMVLGSSTAAKYVGLVQQHQTWIGGLNYNADGTLKEQVYGDTDVDQYDRVVRTLSDNQVDWLLPSEVAAFTTAPETIRHLGWYFDLPANGERVVNDVDIVNGKLIYTTAIPSDSSCESGGYSPLMAVEACTGGITASALFDLNGDGVIDQNDYIQVGDQWVAVSGVILDGITAGVTTAEGGVGLDLLITTEETGDSSVIGSQIFGTPIQYWRELNWQ